MTRRSSVFMAAILAATIGLVGCDDDDDNNNNNNPNSPGTTASPSPAASPVAQPSTAPSPNTGGGNNGGNTGNTGNNNNGENAGNVAAITGIVKRAGNNEIKVGGTFVRAAPGSGIDLSQYRVGEFLRVRGIRQGDGSIMATKITRE